MDFDQELDGVGEEQIQIPRRELRVCEGVEEELQRK